MRPSDLTTTSTPPAADSAGAVPATVPASPASERTTAIPIDRSTRSTNETGTHDHHEDEICAVLAEAARQRRAVVLALVDGTRLNGIPLPDRGTTPPAGSDRRDRSDRWVGYGARTVRLLEEAGTEPFVVRLAHVLYVRALGRPSH